MVLQSWSWKLFSCWHQNRHFNRTNSIDFATAQIDTGLHIFVQNCALKRMQVHALCGDLVKILTNKPLHLLSGARRRRFLRENSDAELSVRRRAYWSRFLGGVAMRSTIHSVVRSISYYELLPTRRRRIHCPSQIVKDPHLEAAAWLETAPISFYDIHIEDVGWSSVIELSIKPRPPCCRYTECEQGRV